MKEEIGEALMTVADARTKATTDEAGQYMMTRVV